MHALAGKSNVRGHKEDDARRDATSLVTEVFRDGEKRPDIDWGTCVGQWTDIGHNTSFCISLNITEIKGACVHNAESHGEQWLINRIFTTCGLKYYMSTAFNNYVKVKHKPKSSQVPHS